MPSGDATVPAKRYSTSQVSPERGRRISHPGRSSAAGHAKGAWHESHALYELVRGTVDVVVDDRHVELRSGRELEPRRVQTALPLLRRLGTPAHQPADQLVPRRRREEDEPRPRHRLPDL